MIGRYYGYAGIFLRAGQTDFTPMDRLATLAGMLPDNWPYLAYVNS